MSFEFLDDRYFLRNLVRLLIRSSVYCGAADAQDMRPDNWRPFSLLPIIVIIIIIVIVVIIVIIIAIIIVIIIAIVMTILWLNQHCHRHLLKLQAENHIECT